TRDYSPPLVGSSTGGEVLDKIGMPWEGRAPTLFASRPGSCRQKHIKPNRNDMEAVMEFLALGAVAMLARGAGQGAAKTEQRHARSRTWARSVRVTISPWIHSRNMT